MLFSVAEASAEGKKLILVWEGETAARAVLPKLASARFDVVSFRVLETLLRYLDQSKGEPAALVIPESVPDREREGFLETLGRDAPDLFASLPTYLLGGGREGGEVVLREVALRGPPRGSARLHVVPSEDLSFD